LYFPEEKLKPFPVGEYQYTGYDKNGKKAVEGQLSITSVESRRIGSEEQPLLKGHWQFSKVGNQETIGPQVGSGELQGSIVNREININLNPRIHDSNVILRGTIEDRRFHGTWSFSGFAGKLSEGTFEAIRK
jgi:hypothetical protein